MKRKTKAIIATLVFIIMLILSIKVNANTMLTSTTFKFEHDKNMLSRIPPKITIDGLKSKINAQDASKLIVYEDETCKTEVTTGYVKMGMALKYESKVYKLVVAGDVDKDGEITQVDLTKVINYIVKLKGSELTDIYYEAADLTCDGAVDQRDLTKYIRYIVLDELDLGSIDTTPPELTLNVNNITSYSLKVEADAVDTGIGMEQSPIYTFYVKKAAEPDSAYVEKQNGTDKVLDLSGLEQNTEYEIKVITHDNSGNEAIKTIKASTIKIPDSVEVGALTIENPIWNNGKAEVKITTNTAYQIEYQVNGTTGTWIKATKGETFVQVKGLEHNDIIYARLTDGVNSGDYITATIIDDIKPQLTLTANAGISNIEVTAIAQDNETGILPNANYVFYIKEADADDSTYVESQNTTSNVCNFTGLEQEKEYKVKVEVKDIAGNVGEEIIKISTHKIPDASDAGILNIGTPIWNNGKAEVSISTTVTNFQIEYQVNGVTGTWTKLAVGDTSVTVTGLKHNDIVYVRLTNGTSAGKYTTVTILDNIKPEVNVSLTPSTSEIEATVTAVDLESGIASDAIYKFSIKKTSEPDTSYVEVQNNVNKTCKFTSLDADESYTVKVEVADAAGNVSIKEETQTTKQIPSATTPGSIMFESPVWTSGKATITIKTSTSFQIEYQVNGISGSWTNGASPIDVNNLNHNDVIYARLTDGTSSGSYVTATIVDTIIPKITLNLQAQNQTIDAVVSAVDSESGISSTATYKFSIKETGTADSAYAEVQNTTDKTCSFASLEVGKNYTVKVEVEDIAGNKAILEKSILIPDDIAPAVTLNITSKTSSKVTAEAGATDVGGLPTPTIYKFYIKETGTADSTYVEVQNSANNTCTFDSLTQGKDYTLKVTVEDDAGNVGIKEVSITTDKIPDVADVGAITFDSVTWASGKATVTISTNTSYQIEYQVNGTTGTWTKGTTVTGLNHYDIIYARLTDGMNSSNPATVTVVDAVKPQVTLSLTSTTSTITATADAKDLESGISAVATYTFYLKEGSLEYVQVQASTSKTCDFTGLTQGTNYTVKVEVEDIAGNVVTKEQTILTKQVPDATTAGAINFSSPTWTLGKAEVTITTTTSFQIEYQVNSSTGSWIKASSPVDVNNLNYNDVLYARLTDGINVGNYIQTTIKDTVLPENFTINVTDVTYESLKIIGSTQDYESGIKDYTYVVENLSGTKVQEITEQTVTEYTIDGLDAETEYVVYMLAYDNAGNERKSSEVTIKTEKTPTAKMFGQYVNYEIDLDDDGDTTNDWQVFYIEDDETSPNYGATYLIADYYVPASKMTTSLANAGMSLYSGTYRVRWASAPTSFVKRDNYDTVKSIFMYDYTGESNTNVKAVSRLLDTTAWESDFVTNELKLKGGLAIGGPTINMWCASWNKVYPTQKITSSINGSGYLLKGYNQTGASDSINLSTYTGYKTDAPNIYFPTKGSTGDNIYAYWLASPSSAGSGSLMLVSYQGNVSGGAGYGANNLAVRPIVYLPASVKLEPSGTANLWNINYGD